MSAAKPSVLEPSRLSSNGALIDGGKVGRVKVRLRVLGLAKAFLGGQRGQLLRSRCGRGLKTKISNFSARRVDGLAADLLANPHRKSGSRHRRR